MRWLDASHWVPCTAPLTSGTAVRSAKLLEQVISQFQVETHKRYQPAQGKTFCNIFVWDVTRALGCELPHWWLGTELTANDLARWLRNHGPGHGWVSALEGAARAHAAEGKPAVALWENPDSGSGHVAILIPPQEAGQTEIAQAGVVNFRRGSLSKGFGSRHITFHLHA